MIKIGILWYERGKSQFFRWVDHFTTILLPVIKYMYIYWVLCVVWHSNELTRKKGKPRKTVSHIDPKDE